MQENSLESVADTSLSLSLAVCARTTIDILNLPRRSRSHPCYRSVFIVDIIHSNAAPSIAPATSSMDGSDAHEASAKSQKTQLWDRKTEGGFPGEHFHLLIRRFPNLSNALMNLGLIESYFPCSFESPQSSSGAPFVSFLFPLSPLRYSPLTVNESLINILSPLPHQKQNNSKSSSATSSTPAGILATWTATPHRPQNQTTATPVEIENSLKHRQPPRD